MAVKDIEASIKRCYSTWSENYYDEYYGKQAAYPPVHRDLLKRLLLNSPGPEGQESITNVLDAGCGPASFLRELADDPIDLYGFDLTPEMIVEARRVFNSLGILQNHLWEGSVLDADDFRSPVAEHPRLFDAAVCVGVLPHIPRQCDTQVMENLRQSVRPGGLVALEARNQLFSLFTLNRYTYQFITEELIHAERLQASANGSSNAVQEAMESFQGQFRMDLPPVRRGKEDEPGYDEVLSRTHNPLILKEQFAAAGFRDVEVLFYHYHCLPPMFEKAMPELFRQQSLAMEDPHDWRGYFMASAFLVTGRRA